MSTDDGFGECLTREQMIVMAKQINAEFDKIEAIMDEVLARCEANK